MKQQLSADNLTLAYDSKVIIKDLHLEIPAGKISVFIGSNGCGKSTILRSLARLLKPVAGTVYLDEKPVFSQKSKEIAKQLSILPQSPQAPEGVTVRQLVKQGRFPYQSVIRNKWSVQDEAAVEQALHATGVKPFEDQPVSSLSGGQRQRAWIAMTIAQQTPMILLDEPTTYLDMAHQVEVLDLLFKLNQQEGRTIVMVLHDLNLACRYADHLFAVKDQQVYCEGKPEDIMTPSLMKEVFGLDCEVYPDPIFGTPCFCPYGQGRMLSPGKVARAMS
ncbi:ABC transporter ATP-binding protein [Paenibacillus apiarius]|uniref:ABC transporter ATP-binding protein n=1 Tax=Paenibacillus apiarius TaxID=46240 RepID=UPI003B3BD663